MRSKERRSKLEHASTPRNWLIDKPRAGRLNGVCDVIELACKGIVCRISRPRPQVSPISDHTIDTR